jgi:hypothetical protein
MAKIAREKVAVTMDGLAIGVREQGKIPLRSSTVTASIRAA